MMPVMESIEVAAIAMPYRPPSVGEVDRGAHASTGSAVARIDTPSPAMMLVPWPVVEACAMWRTGRIRRGVILGDDHHQRGQHRPITAQP